MYLDSRGPGCAGSSIVVPSGGRGAPPRRPLGESKGVVRALAYASRTWMLFGATAQHVLAGTQGPIVRLCKPMTPPRSKRR